MLSTVIGRLVLSLLVVSKTQCEDFVWRANGGIIKVEPVCGKTTSDISHINVYADLPVVVQIFCKGDVVVTPDTTDGVKYSQVAAFTYQEGVQCVFQKMMNSHVYTLKVKVGWESAIKGIAVNQPREYFLIDCSYDDQADRQTVDEHIETARQVYDEIIHNMGPGIQDDDLTLDVVDVAAKPIAHDVPIPLGRSIRLLAVSGQQLMRPVNCIATNGIKMYRLLLGGCGDGMVISKYDGFDVEGKRMLTPYFLAFRLEGSRTMSFMCNFTACHDPSTCDGSSCYYKNRRKRHVRSVALDNPSQYRSASSSRMTLQHQHNHVRTRRSVCRMESWENQPTSYHPLCLEKREDILN